MTRRPEKTRPSNVVPAESEEEWERITRIVLLSQPTAKWECQLGIFGENGRFFAHQRASRLRIISDAIDLCKIRGDAPPGFLVELLKKEIVKTPRAQAKRPTAFEGAINVLAKDPSISINKLATKLGVSRMTAREWKGQLLKGGDLLSPSELPERED